MFKESYIFLSKLSDAFQVIIKYLNKWLLLVKKYIFQKGLILISNLYSIFIQGLSFNGLNVVVIKEKSLSNKLTMTDAREQLEKLYGLQLYYDLMYENND